MASRVIPSPFLDTSHVRLKQDLERAKQAFEAALQTNIDLATYLLQNRPELVQVLKKERFFEQILLGLLNVQELRYVEANTICNMLDKTGADTPFTRVCWAICTHKKPGECGSLSFFDNSLQWRRIDLKEEVKAILSSLNRQRQGIFAVLCEEMLNALRELRRQNP